MSLESSIQALADAIVGFTEVYKNKEFSISAPTIPEKPKKPKKKSKEPEPEPVEPNKNPYREHPSDDGNRDDMIKIIRQEFARVVKYSGEKAAKSLFEKYEIEELEQIKDADIQSFLTDASLLAENGKSGVVVTEVTFDRIKHILTKVFKEKGQDIALKLLSDAGAKDLVTLDEEKYAEVYEEAEKVLAE